jgi:hypothetical protein
MKSIQNDVLNNIIKINNGILVKKNYVIKYFINY